MELYLGRIEILNGDKLKKTAIKVAINTENGDKSGDKMMSDVFVIGAGCSVPYGFPTGATLMQNLKNFDYSSTDNKRKYAKVYATAMGLSSQNRLRISTYLDLMDFEKRNEPEPMPEIENRILKDASAVDLILDYYTLA